MGNVTPSFGVAYFQATHDDTVHAPPLGSAVNLKGQGIIFWAGRETSDGV